MATLYTRVTLRVAPFLILLYLVAFLDRVNVSFASLSMNRDLNIPDDLFGLAAGIFFLGYLLFAVPSNLMLTRLGAPRWIAILMAIWGALSCGLAFVHGPIAYILLRFLIGAAEAGFFPGIILYLTRWLPGSQRGGIMALFTFSIPLSNILGAPISAAILSMNGTGNLHGWQWLFLLEGLPSLFLACLVPYFLAAGPAEVSWLTPSEKQSLLTRIESESLPPETRPSHRELIIPALTYFVLMIGLYALSFWVPRILSSHGVALHWLGWATALPSAFGALGMLLWSRLSDRLGQRQRHLAAALALAATGIATAALSPSHGAFWPLIGFSAAAIGVLAAMPIFWASLSQRLTPARAVVAIAAVNSIGNIGGFLGPYAMGWMLKTTHQFRPGLLATAACLLVGALLALIPMRLQSIRAPFVAVSP